jgi:hypothetical protein
MMMNDNNILVRWHKQYVNEESFYRNVAFKISSHELI